MAKADDAARRAVDELIAKVRQQLVDAGDVRQTAEAGATSSIEDVGAKIGGARKDRWKERGLADLDEMSERRRHPGHEGQRLEAGLRGHGEASYYRHDAWSRWFTTRWPPSPRPTRHKAGATTLQPCAVRKVYGWSAVAKNAYQALRQELGVEARQGSGTGTRVRSARAVLALQRGRSDPFVFGYNGWRGRAAG